MVHVASELTTPRYSLSIEPPFDDGTEWQVVSMTLEESLNSPYRCQLELETDDPTATGANMLGASCELLIDRTSQARRLRGLVSRVEQIGSHEGAHKIRIDIVPALALLKQRQDSRIFQNMTVPEIVREVLASALVDYGRVASMDLRREYEPREYCVQYQVSDLDFVRRLLEEEGIGFYFDHEAAPADGTDEATDVERLVLTDSNDCFARALTAASGAVTLESRSDESADREALFTFDYLAALSPTRVLTLDHDWTRPSSPSVGSAGEADHLGRTREIYEHRQPTQFLDYDPAQRRYTNDSAAHDAGLRHAARTVRSVRARARGNVVGLLPGVTFDLTGHGHPDQNRTWLVVSTRHTGSAGVDDSDEGRPAYESVIECIPADVTWIPPRVTAARRAGGFELARVVGPEGEEIHADEHGRIKVRFPWDRSDGTDDRCSCWLRVQQQWAGPGYGFTFIPRVGMEVVVQFQGGHVDRPLVSGCVYNGQNPSALDLPTERTQSVIRTSSSPGGDGYNEIRFEDQAGAELLSVHAERNLVERVGADRSVSVGANETLRVRGDRTDTIEGALTQDVTGTRTYNVTGPDSDFIVDVANGDLQCTAAELIALACGQTRLLLESQSQRAQLFVAQGSQPHLSMTPERFSLTIGQSKVAMDENNIYLESPHIRLKSKDGEAELYLSNIAELKHPDNVVVSTAKSQVELAGSRVTTTAANADIKGDKGVHIESTQVEVKGATAIKMEGGGAKTSLQGGNVDLNV